jgi:hypothetical protein
MVIYTKGATVQFAAFSPQANADAVFSTCD